MVTATSNKVVEGRNLDLSTVSASPPSAAHLGLVPAPQPRDLTCHKGAVVLGGLELSLGTGAVVLGGLELSLGTPSPLGGGGQILGESMECRLHSFQGLGEGHKLAAGFGYRLNLLQILPA